jgi:hypothetical protein
VGLLHHFFGTEQSAPVVAVDHGGPWERIIKDRPNEGAKQDSTELHDIDPKNDQPTSIDGVLISFEYADANGEVTERGLMCRRCWSSKGTLYVAGYCTLRKAYRTFCVDQMSDVVEARTKRPITDAVAYFGRYAIEKTARVQQRKKRQGFYGFNEQIEDARRVCIDGIRVIAYIAILRDGDITKNSEGAETAYISARLADCGMGDDTPLFHEVLEQAKAIAVPTEAFEVSLKILAADRLNYGRLAVVLGEQPPCEGQALAALQKVIDAGPV